MCAIPLSNQEQMCLLLREAMNVGKIALSDCFFSTELGDREARQRLKDELSSYCVVSEAPKTTFGKFRKTYTGKLYGTAHCGWHLHLHPFLNPFVCRVFRQARRPLHRASAGHDRLPKVFPRPQVQELPRRRLPHALGVGQQCSASRRRLSLPNCKAGQPYS